MNFGIGESESEGLPALSCDRELMKFMVYFTLHLLEVMILVTKDLPTGLVFYKGHLSLADFHRHASADGPEINFLNDQAVNLGELLILEFDPFFNLLDYSIRA